MLELVDVVSNCASPASPVASITVSRIAFLAPVSEFTINENAITFIRYSVVFTPDIAFSESARELKLLFAEFTCINLRRFSRIHAEKLLLPHVPKSIFIDPVLIAAVLDENPENSRVCEDASEDIEIFALNAFALVGSVTETPTAELLELTVKAVDPFDEDAKF